MKTEKHLYDKRILATRLHLLIQSYTPFNGHFSGKPACVSQFPLISSLQWSLSWAASQVRSGHISVHPFHELIQSRRFCRLSVCLCVCPSVNFFFAQNRFYYDKNGSIATKLAQDGQQVSEVCSRSRLRCWHKNCSFSQANGRIVIKLAHNGLQVSAHPGCAQGQGQSQRSCDMGNFVLDRKSHLLAGKWLDCDQTCTGTVCILHNTVVTATSKLKSIYDGVVLRPYAWRHLNTIVGYLLQNYC